MSIHFGANCAKIHTTVPKKIKKVDSLAKVSVSFTKWQHHALHSDYTIANVDKPRRSMLYTAIHNQSTWATIQQAKTTTAVIEQDVQ